MAQQKIQKLLNEVLKKQQDQGMYHLSYERILQALSSGPALSESEKEILWLSPSARAKYIHAKKILQTESVNRWQNKSWCQPQQKLAASAESDIYTLEFDDYKVIIERETDGFVISLILHEELRDSLTMSDYIELIDDKGEIWIGGTPSGEPFIMNDWPYSNEIGDYITRAVKLVLKR
ncbi:hypothetical protein MACH09_45480 [Vibrio sp. MACH09]|uniref:hypothetical protein n=1 Tax=Vibrio sp. MACH09 TaxID=3025122 RepID=UPI00278F36EF|nr:hypothetical protein [Vibrio sp. MACH09]GLO64040.1 hypothetical protein MACH09_45480 [Vibrio sp. MACH09]